MGSVLLVIHLMVAILLVVLILMQRNSGNALSGLGGGSGADSFLSARGKGNLLTRTTAVLATIFFITSISLALYFKGQVKPHSSITDVAPLVQTEPNVPNVPEAAATNEVQAEVPAAVEETPVAEETTAAEEVVVEEVPAEETTETPAQPEAEVPAAE